MSSTEEILGRQHVNDLDEILLKKRVADALANKQTWSIDQTPVHISVPNHVSRR